MDINFSLVERLRLAKIAMGVVVGVLALDLTIHSVRNWLTKRRQGKN